VTTALFEQMRRRLYGAVDVLLTAGPFYVWDRLRADATINAQLELARAAVYDRIWRTAADAVGAHVIDLGAGFLEIEKGRATTRVWQQAVMLDDAVALRLARNKHVAVRLLAAENLPLAERLEFTARSIESAVEFLRGGRRMCVVKPAAGTAGGVGATTGIQTPRELRRAAMRAARFRERLVIERQASGDVYRLLFLDGELLDVVHRLPPRVTGDGDSSIRELIVAENSRRARSAGAAGVEPLRIDLDCILTLRRLGLSLRSRPGKMKTVPVKTVTNQNAPLDNATWRGVLASELVESGAAAANALGLRVAGVDIITPDPSRPLREVGGVVIEVNGAPGLHHHYQVADPAAATPVAIAILHKLLEESSRDTAEPAAPRYRRREPIRN
jgi:cyanophycin synthetase